MDVTIRTAVPSDMDALVRLLGILFSIESDFRPDPVRQRQGVALMLAAPEQRTVLVAEYAGDVVGMVTGQLVVSTAEGGRSLLVEDMVIEAAHRRRGIGRLLLAAVDNWARARGATRLQLLADRENVRALRFYEQMGLRSTQLMCLRCGGT